MATGLLHHTAVARMRSRLATFTERTRVSRAFALTAAASLSAIAGVLHAAVVPAHLTDWPLAGAFFIAVVAAQCAFAIALLLDPPRAVLALGVAGTAGLIGLYALSRTIGIPLGPHAFDPETVGTIDLLSLASELGLLALLLQLKVTAPSPDRAPVRRTAHIVRLTVALAIAAMGTATASPIIGHHGNGEIGGHALGDGMLDGDLHAAFGRPFRDRMHAADPTEHGFDGRCAAPTGSPAAITANDVAGRATAFFYHDHDGNLWVHDLATNRKSVVLSAPGCWFEQAKIRDERSLSLAIDGRVWLLDLSTGGLERLKLGRWVSVHDWSPDGTRVAFLRWPEDGGGADVWVRDMATGVDRLLIELRREEMMGCGGDGGAITSIDWSTDGRKLLVEVPFFAEEQLFVLDAETGTIRREFEGSYAMWLPDATRVAAHVHGETMAWQVIDLSSDIVKTFEVGGWRERPALSPDGTKIAFDDNERRATTYVLDLSTGVERAISSEHAAPVWIDDTTIAANRLGDCRPYVCGHYPWPQADAVDLLPVDGTAPVAVDATSSVHATVLFPNLPASPVVPGVGERFPVFEPREQVEVYPLEKVTLQVRASDPDGSDVRYSARSLPRRARFDSATATFTWRPGLRDDGVHRITFVATNERGRAGEQTIRIVVRPITELVQVR